MTLRFNWKRLTEINRRLVEFDPKDELSFFIFLKDESIKNLMVHAQDFLPTLWKLGEQKKFKIVGLIVKDPTGQELFRYKKLTRGNEEIPEGGNGDVVLRWNTFSELEKDTYLKLLVSQINAQTE